MVAGSEETRINLVKLSFLHEFYTYTESNSRLARRMEYDVPQMAVRVSRMTCPPFTENVSHIIMSSMAVPGAPSSQSLSGGKGHKT